MQLAGPGCTPQHQGPPGKAEERACRERGEALAGLCREKGKQPAWPLPVAKASQHWDLFFFLHVRTLQLRHKENESGSER